MAATHYQEVFKPGRVAVITGGASGIGYAVVRKCALEHRMKVCMADIDQAAMDEKKKELLAAGASEVLVVRCDVSKVEDVEALAGEVYAAFGEVAFLHLNAGMACGLSSFGTPLPQWKLCLDINLYGVVNGLNVFTPRMTKGERPSKIVASTSLAGFINTAEKTGIPYVVAKHGVTLTMESLEHELRQRQESQHVRAHLLIPGLVRTNIEKTSRSLTASLGLAGGADHLSPAGLLEQQVPGHRYEEISYAPGQLADGLFERLLDGDFYCIVTPRVLPEPLFKALVGLRAEDVMHDRQPLSHHLPEERRRAHSRLRELGSQVKESRANSQRPASKL